MWCYCLIKFPSKNPRASIIFNRNLAVELTYKAALISFEINLN